MSKPGCWVCDEPEIVYADVFNLGWCQVCFDEIYMESR